MLPELLKKSSLFLVLNQIDIDLAEECRSQNCLYCDGPLHRANYPRKPWGHPKDVPDKKMIRQSLCCGRRGCRKRMKPPSCIYMGRKKYWSGIIIVVMALRQNGSSKGAIKIMRMFNIPYKTFLRWRTWFRDEFPTSAQWKNLRGRVNASIGSDQLPGGLLDYFIRSNGSDEKGLIGCLQFLAN